MRSSANMPPLQALRAFEAAGRLLSFRRAAEELAQNALDEYNDWLSGACYGCVVEEFELQNPGCEPDEAEWHQIDIDHCWGYIGEYAEEALKVEHFNPAVKRLNEENEGVAA